MKIVDIRETVVPIGTFMARIAQGKIPRVPGTAVFLTRTERDAPPVMVWHLKHNRALHERVFILTTVVEAVPWVERSTRLTVEEIAPSIWRAKRPNPRRLDRHEPSIPIRNAFTAYARLDDS